ncbi:MAG TPA: hypothetical protein VFV70_07885 [Hyphomonadaceae bacterium]|nr:hypothetical protein [Hyphomonadaceae bacterium]
MTSGSPMHPASDASLWIDRQLPTIADAARRLGHCRRIRPEWSDEVRLILGEVIRLNLTPARRRPAPGVEFDRCTRREGGPSKARDPALRTLRHLRYVAFQETAFGYDVRPGVRVQDATGKNDWRLIDIIYGPNSAMAGVARRRRLRPSRR